ncbi:MAG: bifunctional phosphopantothenoylcysteine decarboxylase/phosphopantothenate--cysteine ligase CoaBC [Oxalobacter sp.]|nr:bifunctional phosphopantothenoylcysteine decarboxylase/phosphopantothenate--cysteine ligase CoaBC [Oxalobacter sp.]
MELSGKTVLLGLTGGIACYKAAEFARAMIREGATVHAVMTESAQQFITPLTLQALTGNPVFTSSWDNRQRNNMPHIDLPRKVDVIAIAPCTANFIAKLANGICDDLLSTLCQARPAAVPLLVAPAMNVEMWEKPATQRNIRQIQADGVGIMGPASGFQACGEVGKGRMLEPAELVEEVIAALQPKTMAGRRFLVTAGPTFEPIDPVRGITNRSSGKMGYAIARAAWLAGAEVTLVSGPTALPVPYGVKRIDVISAREMFDAVTGNLEGKDVFISVAAVADWRVKQASVQKIKKVAGQAVPALEFVENPDILASVAKLPDAPYCVGFAAESENLREYAEAKRRKKGIPLLVGNIGHETFGKDDNTLILFDDAGALELPHDTKRNLARKLIEQLASRL